jgi:hypothetical protein
MREELIGQFSTDPISRFQSNRLEWHDFKGSPQFDYPIDYSVAVTSFDRRPARSSSSPNGRPTPIAITIATWAEPRLECCRASITSSKRRQCRPSTKPAGPDFRDKPRRASSTWNMGEQTVRRCCSFARRSTGTSSTLSRRTEPCSLRRL